MSHQHSESPALTNSVRVYLALIASALVFAAALKAPLSWDGSFILFKILDSRAPVLVEHRLAVMPLQAPVLAAAALTDHVGLLQVVFGLSYAAVPLLALALSWWVVRKRAPWLFVYPALGIGLGTLPGQFFFVGEAVMAIQLFWPIMLALLLGLPTPRKSWPALAALWGLAMLAHPVGVALSSMAATLALVRASRYARDRRRLLPVAGLLIVAAFARYSMVVSPYEVETLRWGPLLHFVRVSVKGYVFVALLCAWSVALLVWVIGWRSSRHAAPVGLRRLIVLGLGSCGLVLIAWVVDPARWREAHGFRAFALLAEVPFVAAAAVDALGRLPETRVEEHDVVDAHRLVLLVTGLVFLLVLGSQAVVWHRLTRDLNAALEVSGTACLTTAEVSWLDRTPLHHWSTPAYAILLQGRRPRTLLLTGDGCDEFRQGEPFRLVPWERRAPRAGWFDLSTAP